MSTDKIKLILAGNMRDSIHNLDATSAQGTKILEESTASFITTHEGVVLEAYDDGSPLKGDGKLISNIFKNGEDIKGNRTIGTGFNMDRPEARAELDSVFHNKLSFDDAYNGKLKLSHDQGKDLLSYGLKIREKELAKIYGGYWNKLKANEKAAITSAYYNSPKTVGSGTNFCRNMKLYAATGDQGYLNEAMIELRHKSNPKNENGIRIRRHSEADLLDSRNAPFYRKPTESAVPDYKLRIILGQTIVPRGLSSHFAVIKDSEYFIWRTQLDDRVRYAHDQKEGRVYRRDDPKNTPPDGYNCRCYTEEITENLEIIAPVSEEQKSLSWFIRFGGGRSIVLR